MRPSSPDTRPRSSSSSAAASSAIAAPARDGPASQCQWEEADQLLEGTEIDSLTETELTFDRTKLVEEGKYDRIHENLIESGYVASYAEGSLLTYYREGTPAYHRVPPRPTQPRRKVKFQKRDTTDESASPPAAAPRRPTMKKDKAPLRPALRQPKQPVKRDVFQ